jgi:hypothetical protein
MLAYRLEHRETRVGPYFHSPKHMQDVMGEDFGRASNVHPLACADTMLDDSGGCQVADPRYCFVSIDQLLRWFYDERWLDTLDREGFVVRVYDVHPLYIGRTQCIFDGRWHHPDHLRQTININDLCNGTLNTAQ